MTEEGRNDEILIQQLPRRGISSAVYTLQVPNVFTLAEYGNTISELFSPNFEFVNSIFRFRIFYWGHEGDKYFHVFLKRISLKKLKQRLFYEIQLIDEDEIYDDRSGTQILDSVKDGVHLSQFTNKNSSCDERDVLTFMVHLMCVESTEREEEQALMRKLSREMIEEVRDDKIIMQQLPRKGISSAVYTLTLAEFDSKNSEVCSPNFEFVNSTWRFRITSGTFTVCLELCLERINFKKAKQRIFYEVELLKGKNEVYDAEGDVRHFEGNDSRYLYRFRNNKASHDKRDVLTLTVHLIYVESTEMIEDQLSMRSSESELSSDGTEVVSSKIKAGSVLSLRDDLKSMLLNGQDHNLTFNVSGKNFRAHQDILRARSDVFRSMLTHDMLEKNKGVIDVPDIDPEAFEQLLFYIYTGEVETLNESFMFALYYAADKYNLAALKEECCEFIKKSLTNTNVCGALSVATKHSDEGLLNSAMNYFFSNVDDILLTVEWQLFMKDNTTVANELFIKSLKKVREAQAS